MNPSGKVPPKPRFRVEINWKLALFSLLLLPLLIGLGFWQLQRAEEKRTIQESWQRQQALPSVDFAAAEGGSAQDFRRVTARGRFDAEHYWLLENQILGGRLGYAVVMPFRVAGSGQVILVNRGWVPAGAYRDELPAVETPAGERQVTGTLVKPSQNRLIDEAPGAASWPVKLLQVDPELMGRQLQHAGYSARPHNQVLRLDAESPGALRVEWQPINLSPATHMGYAVQWFGLAMALLVLTVFANTNLASVLFRRRAGGEFDDKSESNNDRR